MKKLLAILLVLVMTLACIACSAQEQTATEQSDAVEAVQEEAVVETAEESAERPLVGVCWYNYSDTFISNARKSLSDSAENGDVYDLIEADSLGEIPTQVSNINNLYTQEVDYLLVNNINVNESGNMIKKAMEEDVAILFVNCTSPSDEELAMYDRAWHISSKAEQSGVIMGEIVTEYWNAHPEADRNGNGKMDYIMLLGLQDHYDTIVRASESIATVEAAGIETELVQEGLCHYQRAEAQDTVASILQARQDDVEAVFACNDDMALGAIGALKAAGFFADDNSFIPVLGVDATAVGVEAIKEGTYLGTALNNPVKLGQVTNKLVELMIQGEEVTTEAIGIDGVSVEGQHIMLDFIAITAENTEDAAY